MPNGERNFGYGVYRRTPLGKVPVPGVSGNGNYTRDPAQIVIDTDRGNSTITPVAGDATKIQLQVDKQGTFVATLKVQGNQIILQGTGPQSGKTVTITCDNNGFSMESKGLGKDGWGVQARYS
jgi:hypothetical protein